MITIFALMFLFIVGNGILLVGDNKVTKNITSLSPDWEMWKQVKQHTIAPIMVFWPALNENFEVHADGSKPTVGNITLYKASLENSEPILLDFRTTR
ncbi:hypothetical protein [Oceanobacillus picturae]|uniref:hypothetical protein n=1 Tax=Oceanobacillus picturae TaxID=171693 RepID=UPI003630C6A0